MIIFLFLLWDALNAKYDPTKKTSRVPSKFQAIDISHVFTEFDCGFDKEVTGTKCFLVLVPSPCSDRNGPKTINYPASFN